MQRQLHRGQCFVSAVQEIEERYGTYTTASTDEDLTIDGNPLELWGILHVLLAKAPVPVKVFAVRSWRTAQLLQLDKDFAKAASASSSSESAVRLKGHNLEICAQQADLCPALQAALTLRT